MLVAELFDGISNATALLLTVLRIDVEEVGVQVEVVVRRQSGSTETRKLS